MSLKLKFSALKTDLSVQHEMIKKKWIDRENIICRRIIGRRQIYRLKDCGWLKEKLVKTKGLSVNGPQLSKSSFTLSYFENTKYIHKDLG